MPIIFDERPESRSWNLAKGEGVLEYQLIGIHDDADAAAYAYARVPIYFRGAWLQDIQLKPQGNQLWYVTCPYGPLPKMPGSIEINSRTTGGTVHIAASKSMVSKYGTGAPDTVIIGQDGGGAEITVPLQMRSYTFNFGRGLVTEALMDYWEDLVGLVNNAPWHNRPAGEVLFLGHDAKTTLSADPASAVSFDFAMTRNRTAFTIGNIVGINKQGHDLIDVHTKTVAIAGQDVQQEKFVYIQRVYDRANYTAIFGF
jgi:hypothetical protein